MELRPSWEAASCAATQEFPKILWNLKVHWLQYSQEPSTGPYPEPDQSSLPHPISLRSILILTTHLHLGLSSGIFLSGFPTNILYAFLFSPVRATCPAYLILLHLITLIVLAKGYKLRSSSLCSFFWLPVTSSLFSLNVLLSTLFSKTFSYD
jgi:hypothetical protein